MRILFKPLSHPNNNKQKNMLKHIKPHFFSTTSGFTLQKIPSPPRSTFKSEDLQINLTSTPNTPSIPQTFGTLNSDHMLTIKYTNKDGWGAPVIHPFENLKVHPFSSGLNYAIQCYEGLKAYKDEKDQVRLFRPELNMQRFRHSCNRISLPDFCPEELLTLVKELVKIDAGFIPKKQGYSLYLRPFAFATNQSLGVRAPDQAQLNVVCSPVGPYYPQGFKPAQLYIEEKAVRCAPGGAGGFKLGSNYGPTVKLARQAEEKGFTQILWTWEGKILEVGTSNIFFYMKGKNGQYEIVTPKADDMVLHGVTRDSAIGVLRAWGIPVIERDIFLPELIEKLKKKEVKEVFATGTAVTIGSVDSICYRGDTLPLEINQTTGAGELTWKLYNEIFNIQYGKTQHEWSQIIS